MIERDKTIVYLGSDHGGYLLKEELKIWLVKNGFTGEDLGADSFDPEDDYPDFILPLAKKVAADPSSFGIVIGRSGNGEAIAANKIKRIRAALCMNKEMARKAREHNNANIISLGADYIDTDQAESMVKIFLETPFSHEERHIRRLAKIEEVECCGEK